VLHPTRVGLLASVLLGGPLALSAQSRDTAAPPAPPDPCANAAAWNTPQRPFRLHGATYYVGTRCLSAILVTSPAGHVLIDAGLPTSAALVLDNVRALGFRVADVKLLLNSHAHFDHAGGLAAVQRASGAAAAASQASARVLAAGASGRDDPQYGGLPSFPPLRSVRVLTDGETVRLGPLALTAHATPGHTPGGTSWSWRSCEAGRCLDLVYADSQTPVSAEGFSFTRSRAYPTAVQDFARGQATLERLRCDVLLTPHPAASQLWERVAARDAGGPTALADGESCRRYAAAARQQVAKRVAQESAAR
jgi:metallo-beta-lactamase class B